MGQKGTTEVHLEGYWARTSDLPVARAAQPRKRVRIITRCISLPPYAALTLCFFSSCSTFEGYTHVKGSITLVQIPTEDPSIKIVSLSNVSSLRLCLRLDCSGDAFFKSLSTDKSLDILLCLGFDIGALASFVSGFRHSVTPRSHADDRHSKPTRENVVCGVDVLGEIGRVSAIMWREVDSYFVCVSIGPKVSSMLSRRVAV